MPVRIEGPWTLVIGPGSIVLEGLTVRLDRPCRVEVTPPETVSVRDERHDAIPVYNKATPWGWTRGARLERLVTQECSATGLLHGDSVRVGLAPGGAKTLVRGRDFEIDPFWATLGRLEGGAIAAGQTVFVDYDYTPQRIDCVVAGEDGARVVRGTPGVSAVPLPVTPPGMVPVASIFLSGPTTELSEENLFPITGVIVGEGGPAEVTPTNAKQTSGKSSAPPRESQCQADRFLPRTLARLRNGEPVTIVAWGDSVTSGGGVRQLPDAKWYQYRFKAELRKRFPTAHIRVLTAAWPGATSAMYLNSPKGSHYDFVRDVLGPKPDLVTIEFVNDSSLSEEETVRNYTGILDRIQGAGAEAVLIAPHLVRPDWMGVKTLKFDADPRPYVAGLRRVARERGVALADVSAQWVALWHYGIPYTTLLANSINHPDDRGHQISAATLMDLFPDR